VLESVATLEQLELDLAEALGQPLPHNREHCGIGGHDEAASATPGSQRERLATR
jgi:hypothetical protein